MNLQNISKLKIIKLQAMRAFMLFSAIVWLISGNNLLSQELNCNIQVRQPQTAGVSSTLYQNMQKQIYEFMNNTKWTNHQYEYNERIECSILINISSVSGNKYTSTIQIISNRPVYSTSLPTAILNYKEEDNLFEFEYYENQNFEFNENRHTSNLTSVLAFYAYIILGLDYDSFSNEGGTEFYQKAQKIVNNAQGSNDKGWRAYEAKKQDNRYFLVENLLNSRYSGFRRAIYRYHRYGLDVMTEKLESGRAEIVGSLRQILNVYRQNTNLFIIKLFFDVKSSEIINIFSQSFPTEKTKVFDILKEADPAHISQYEKLLKSEQN
jgi:hypothetical protein